MYSPLHFNFKTPPTHAPISKKFDFGSPKFIGDAYKSPIFESRHSPKRKMDVVLPLSLLDDIEKSFQTSRIISPHTPTNGYRHFTPSPTGRRFDHTSFMSPTNFKTPNRARTPIAEMPTPTPFKQTGAIAARYRNHVAKPTTHAEEFIHVTKPTTHVEEFIYDTISTTPLPERSKPV